MSDAAAEDLRKLFGHVYPMISGGNAAIEGAHDMRRQANFDAFQLAIWEIANERDLLSGVELRPKQVEPSHTMVISPLRSAGEIAQGWLDDLDGTASDSWASAKNLMALSLNGKQDFIVQVVPIPAAFWLFGSAVLGMVMLGRRKKSLTFA